MTQNEKDILYFEDCSAQACKLARYLGIPFKPVDVHHFPDEESLVTIPAKLAKHAIFFRSLNQPNEKLIELLFAAKTARKKGVKRLTLVAPYLCYMRQDIENNPGEAISQQIIGQFLSELFDDVITVDSHLHRISHLGQVIKIKNAINIMATVPIADFIKNQFNSGLIFGPDQESEQWVKQVANKIGFEYAVATKIRSGDRTVKIELGNVNYENKNIIILDDIASTGRTIGLAAQLLQNAGACSISAFVTHAIFCGDAKQYLAENRIKNLWSTDSISDESNSVNLTTIIADALNSIL